jgi:polysaccharide pyruvyl transferase WcaK-like protein
MRIHHFYPRTNNIGDHFVHSGIHALVHSIRKDAKFEVFDINSRGSSRTEYGLTEAAIQRANREADLIIVGGSNLYEGAFGWPWGVALDRKALADLRVPLFLVGIGSGSAFASPMHRPSSRAQSEIKLLNEVAAFSWVRDVTTLEWLQNLGITKAEMLGDPASFLFNQPYREPSSAGHILIVVPPYRFWSSRRNFAKTTRFGRPIFHALVKLAGRLINEGQKVVVACNDQRELSLANGLFEKTLSNPVVCPGSEEDYFQLLVEARLLVSGRLHTAAVALSQGLPFLLLDLDQRTRGFIETYGLDHAALSWSRVSGQITGMVDELLGDNHRRAWLTSIQNRDNLARQASERLGSELAKVHA